MELTLSDGQITAQSGQLTLKRLSYTIMDKYEGEKQVDQLVFVNEYAEPDEVLDELWEFIDTGEDEDIVTETCELLDAHAYLSRFDELAQRKYRLREALKIAGEQRRNHEQQVSGAWGVNAVDFCEEYELDFDCAMDLQEESNGNKFEQTLDETLANIQARTGKLTEEQLENVRRSFEKNHDNSRIGEAFWEAIISQIKKELE